MELNKVCAIISCYPQSYVDSALVSLTIESIKREGYKTCLVSHAPVNTDIQRAVNYFIYTDENVLTTTKSNSYIFNDLDTFYYQTNTSGFEHGYAVMLNIKNSITFLKTKGFTHFVYFEPDGFLNADDHKSLKSMLDNANFLNSDYWFMNETYNSDNLYPVTSIFAGRIDFFIGILDRVNDVDDFINSMNDVSLEMFFRKSIEGLSTGVIEKTRPRDCFTSPWVGISGDGYVNIPGLNNVKIFLDLLRVADDSNVICYLFRYDGISDNISIKGYINNTININTEIKTPRVYYYWTRSINRTDKIKFECFGGDRLIKTLEFNGDEILDNQVTYIKFK